MNISSSLLIILTSLIGCTLFSGIEIAIISANKLKIELDNKQGRFTANLLSTLLKKPSWFIGTILIGYYISLVVYTIFISDALLPSLHNLFSYQFISYFFLIVIAVLVFVIFAEYIPQLIFNINPNRILNFLAIPMVVIYYLFWLPMILTVGFSELISGTTARNKSKEKKLSFGRIDLDNYIEEATTGLSKEIEIEHEILIFKNALDFSSLKARDCMIPRIYIVAMPLESSIEQLNLKFTEKGISKILIYKDDIDNIIGYVHCNEMFNNPKSVESIVLPISIVPETMSANEILSLFIKQKKGIAIVVDEFGGTSGLLTTEDIVEEIFGDIEDEHDNENLLDEKINDFEYNFSGRHYIKYLNEEYKLNLLESDEYDTLGGLIIHQLQYIPEKNQVIHTSQFRFHILGVSSTRIEYVNLSVKE